MILSLDMAFEKGFVPWIKGKKHSPESILKMRESHKMAMADPEVRKRMSEVHKGQISWNKGKHFSEESKIRMSIAQKKSWSNPELRKRHSETLKKAYSNPEFRKRISQIRKKVMSNPEVRKKMSDAHKGQIAWNKGIPASEEAKQEHSLFMRNYYKTHKHPLLNKIYTDEQRKNISLAQKKRFSSPEERKRLSERQKGRTPWNKGKTGIYSEEFKKRVGDFFRGKRLSEEHRKKISESQKGERHWTKYKIFSEASRKKMSESAKRAWTNPDLKRKQSDVHKGQISNMKGKKHSSESILKMQEAHKGAIAWNKGLKGSIPWNKGKTGIYSEEQLKRMSEIGKKLMSNPEYRKRIGEGVKKAFSTPEAKKRLIEIHSTPEAKAKSREQMIKNIQQGKYTKIRDTLPEKMIKHELIKKGYKEEIDFVHQYNLYNRFVCDFCFPKQKVLIEVNGDFYHANPIKYSGKNLHEIQKKSLLTDKRKEAYIKVIDNGSWTLITIWESDINANVAKCVDRIVEVLKSKNK